MMATVGPDGGADPVLSFETAMLFVVLAVVAFLARQVGELRRTVRTLENRLAIAPAGLATATAAAAGPSVSETVPAVDDDDEAAVVIAATVVAVWGRSARVISVKEQRDQPRLWALEGRRQIFASHKIR